MIAILWTYRQYLIGAAIGLFLAGVTVVPVARHIAYEKGRGDGRAGLQAEIAKASLEAERQRAKDDATLQNLSDYDLCVAGLPDGLRDHSACNVLRGLPPEQSEP